MTAWHTDDSEWVKQRQVAWKGVKLSLDRIDFLEREKKMSKTLVPNR
jgi:hypothetical protein